MTRSIWKRNEIAKVSNKLNHSILRISVVWFEFLYFIEVNMLSRAQRILKAALAHKEEKNCDVVLIPPIDSDIENSSEDDSEEEIMGGVSDCESDVPSIDSEIGKMIDELADSSGM